MSQYIGSPAPPRMPSRAAIDERAVETQQFTLVKPYAPRTPRASRSDVKSISNIPDLVKIPYETYVTSLTIPTIPTLLYRLWSHIPLSSNADGSIRSGSRAAFSGRETRVQTALPHPT
jgi:hypothetical protein